MCSCSCLVRSRLFFCLLFWSFCVSSLFFLFISLFIFFFFFFSSRRRHTRLVIDWSSDVCSSDLFAGFLVTTNRALELVRRHVKGLVGSNQAQILAADSQQRHTLGNRHVDFFRRVHRAVAVHAFFVRGSFGFAGHSQAHQVCRRPPTGQAARETVATDGLGEPANYRSLQGYCRRTGAPAGDILIQGASQQVGNRAQRFP